MHMINVLLIFLSALLMNNSIADFESKLPTNCQSNNLTDKSGSTLKFLFDSDLSQESDVLFFPDNKHILVESHSKNPPDNNFFIMNLNGDITDTVKNIPAYVRSVHISQNGELVAFNISKELYIYHTLKQNTDTIIIDRIVQFVFMANNDVFIEHYDGSFEKSFSIYRTKTGKLDFVGKIKTNDLDCRWMYVSDNCEEAFLAGQTDWKGGMNGPNKFMANHVLQFNIKDELNKKDKGKGITITKKIKCTRVGKVYDKFFTTWEQELYNKNGLIRHFDIKVSYGRVFIQISPDMKFYTYKALTVSEESDGGPVYDHFESNFKLYDFKTDKLLLNEKIDNTSCLFSDNGQYVVIWNNDKFSVYAIDI